MIAERNFGWADYGYFRSFVAVAISSFEGGGVSFDVDRRLVSLDWQGKLLSKDWRKALSFILLSSNILSPDCVRTVVLKYSSNCGSCRKSGVPLALHLQKSHAII